jgi:hypothetical protein
MNTREPFGIDPEDLGVRARRGLLSRAEQRELERATDASPTLRLAYEIGRDMDAVTAVRGGDDALIAAAAAAALARVTSLDRPNAERSASSSAERSAERSSRARRMASAAAIGLLVLAASGAAAAFFRGALQWPFVNTASEAPAPAMVSPLHARRTKPAAPPPSQPAPTLAAPAELATAPQLESPAAARPRAHRSGAAELFHSANAARRAGEFARAERLYAELCAAYRDSAEGELARVSLGQLLLARGDASDAEREFRRYLARGRGQLVEEALVGRAQSFERLGSARAERENLRRLLADFPRSVYAAQARARLAALEREASSAPP